MLDIALQAVSIPENRDGNSASSGFNMATSIMKRVKVTPVVSQTSSKIGAFLVGDAGGVAVERRKVVGEREVGERTLSRGVI